MDDWFVLSGIAYVIRNIIHWKDAPKAYGQHKTLYSCFIRWSCFGVFDRIFTTLAEQARRAAEARRREEKRKEALLQQVIIDARERAVQVSTRDRDLGGPFRYRSRDYDRGLEKEKINYD